tara:strand:- start:28 stop:243 length:216 start_codon:yes stop_codon:yes gene_type:complete
MGKGILNRGSQAHKVKTKYTRKKKHNNQKESKDLKELNRNSSIRAPKYRELMAKIKGTEGTEGTESKQFFY